ncbi:ArsR family transcriptional regulator [Natronococcus sp.]|uniref:ArsR family transcriptional regulator n=1 Tax=Natronococcus sp. TaxID=35747 RepID=UPI003A4DABA9
MSEEVLRELPPTALLVYRALEDADDPLTKVEIADRTYRPEPSIDNALSQLAYQDLIDSDYLMTDRRKKVYYLDS